MQITITISDELAGEAEAREISIEAYVQSLVEQARPKTPRSQDPRTTTQIERFFAAMAEGSEKLPFLMTESFTRESFYEDRV
jgi:hypothetical protein